MKAAQRHFAQLAASTVIPVIRTATTANAAKAVSLLEKAGFTTFEVTLTVPGALELIRELSGRGGSLVGAGTVMTVDQAERCLAAGAHFLVSPAVAEALPRLCRDSDVPLLLGGLTPTEVQRAWALGATAVKVFPAGSMGGPSYLRALKSVFPEVPLVPTGGVTLENLSAYLAAGATCVGIGSDLISDAQLQGADDGEWIARARSYLERARPTPTTDLKGS